MSGLISAAAQRLRAALAAVTGGGLVGYSSGETYAAGTIGAGLKAEEAARASAVSSLASTVATNASTAAAATSAVAQDLTEHETATATALAGKAALSGAAGQVFNVAPATAPEHAVRLGQFSYERSGDAWKITRPDGVIEIGQAYTSTNDPPENFTFPFGGFSTEVWQISITRYGTADIGVAMGVLSWTNAGFVIDRADTIDGVQNFWVRAIGR